MTRNDLRVLCTALAFSTVVSNDLPRDKAALRATTIAGLIEAFCRSSVPEAFELETCCGVCCDAAAVDQAINRYKSKLRTEGAAELPPDRDTLIKFYDRLLLRKEREEQQEFYNTGSIDLIANRVLHMVEDEISCDLEGSKPCQA